MIILYSSFWSDKMQIGKSTKMCKSVLDIFVDRNMHRVSVARRYGKAGACLISKSSCQTGQSYGVNRVELASNFVNHRRGVAFSWFSDHESKKTLRH